MGGKEVDEDEVLYRIFLGFGLFAALFGAAIRIFHLENVWMKPCLFYQLTGWYCPGCGGTRALLALLAGRVADSLRLHPLVLYGACFFAVFTGSHTIKHLSGGRFRGMRYSNRYLAAAVLILAANWLVKNYYLLIKGIALL